MSDEAGSVLNFIANRRRMSLLFLGLLACQIALFAMASRALAQTAPDKEKKGGKRTTINFEDQLIEGRRQKPELFVLLQNRMNNSRRLFKLRENFLPEMRKTAEDVGAQSNVRGSAEPSK